MIKLSRLSTQKLSKELLTVCGLRQLRYTADKTFSSLEMRGAMYGSHKLANRQKSYTCSHFRENTITCYVYYVHTLVLNTTISYHLLHST